jgi:hypothetical protein
MSNKSMQLGRDARCATDRRKDDEGSSRHSLPPDRRAVVNFSRRVDCAPFQQWLLSRIDEGFAHGINPFTRKPYEVKLTTDHVKLLVLWTKAPGQIVETVEALVERNFSVAVFVTINNYDEWLEPWVPSLKENLDGVRRINRLIGHDGLWWRFDPVVPTDKQDLDWFKKHLRQLCQEMACFTTRCITSIVNTDGPAKYRRCAKNIDDAAKTTGQRFRPLTRNEKLVWVGELSNVVHQVMGIPLEVCCHPFVDNANIHPAQAKTNDQCLLGAKEISLVQSYPHLRPAHCISDVAVDKLGVVGDKRDGTHSLGSKRKGDVRYDLGMCHCRKSTDIGGNVACPHGCVYCQWPHATEQGPLTVQVDPSNPALLST